MVWITLIALIIAFVCIIRLRLYHNQIKKMSEDIRLIQENRSRIRLTQEIGTKDVTELVKQLNDLLNMHRLMEVEYTRAELRLKELITNLSHDIRTPLTSLDGYFQLLRDSETEEERQRYYQIIEGRISSLKGLLDELFMYMKLQNGNYELTLKPCRLDQILCDTLFSFYQEFTNRKIEPKISLPEEDIIVNGNELALTRIVQNIVKNVFEHGSSDFALNVALTEQKVTMEFRNHIPEGTEIDITQVFERFYKADKSRSHTSTGLGLAIVKELVERMNGEINASADKGDFIISISMPVIISNLDKTAIHCNN